MNTKAHTIVSGIEEAASAGNRFEAAAVCGGGALDAVLALLLFVLAGSPVFVGVQYGWVWGLATGISLWGLTWTIVTVCACIVGARKYESPACPSPVRAQQ